LSAHGKALQAMLRLALTNPVILSGMALPLKYSRGIAMRARIGGIVSGHKMETRVCEIRANLQRCEELLARYRYMHSIIQTVENTTEIQLKKKIAVCKSELGEIDSLVEGDPILAALTRRSNHQDESYNLSIDTCDWICRSRKKFSRE
jgi:hypothetical protein